MKEEIFEKHPVSAGLGILVGVVTLFGLLDFSANNLAIIAFLTTIILVIAYFDNRIKKLEQQINDQKSFNKGETFTLPDMRINKKGLTSFAWMIIIVLILILLYFLYSTSR